MSVKVQCQCGETFLAPEKAGARVKCPHCGVKFALRELHETGAGDLTPLPPERPVRPVSAAVSAPAAAQAPPAPAVRSVDLLDQPLARRPQASDKPTLLSGGAAAVIGLLGAAALIIAALGYNAYLRDYSSADTASAAVEWPEYSSASGRFAVRFPANVETREGVAPLGEDEAPFESARSTSPDDTVLEVVSYEVDPPRSAAERERMLEEFCDALDEEFRLSTRRNVARGGYQGRELAYEERIDALADIVQVQVYSAGSRFLKFTTRRISNLPQSSDSERFFKSLRILDPPPGA